MSIGTITSTGKIESNKSSVNLTYKRLCHYISDETSTPKVQSFIIMCDESVDDLSSLMQFMLLHGSKTEKIGENYETFCATIPLSGGFYTGGASPTVYTILSHHGRSRRSVNPPEWERWLSIIGFYSTTGNAYESLYIISSSSDGSGWWIEDL